MSFGDKDPRKKAKQDEGEVPAAATLGPVAVILAPEWETEKLDKMLDELGARVAQVVRAGMHRGAALFEEDLAAAQDAAAEEVHNHQP